MAHRTSEHDLSGRKNSPLNSSACPFETQASAADACSLSLQLQCMQCSTCMQHACMASFSCLREGHRFRITTTVSPSTAQIDLMLVSCPGSCISRPASTPHQEWLAVEPLLSGVSTRICIILPLMIYLFM